MWMAEAQRFEPIKFDVEKKFTELLALADKPLTQKQRDFARVLYGPGEIIVPSANVFLLFLDELLNPFYIFQIFSLGIWYWEGYTLFAIVLSVLSAFSILSSVWDSWSANRRVRNLAKYTCEVEILQADGSFKACNSTHLLPGDVIKVPTGIALPVDMIQISGISIANEALLTGESIPVIKQQLPKSDDETYNDSKSKHTLYAGTTIIQNKKIDGKEVLGMVRSTGFQTQKGALVKDILFPKPFVFQFQRDVYKFVFLLAAISCIGFLCVIPGLTRTIESKVKIV